MAYSQNLKYILKTYLDQFILILNKEFFSV